MIAILKRKYLSLVSDNRFSEILTGSIYALTSRMVAAGLSLVSSIIVARFYGAETVGILAVVNSFLILVTIFTASGTGSSILRLIPEHLARHSITSAFHVYRKTQYFVFAVSVVTGIAFFYASGIVADKVFSKPQLSYIFSLAAAFVVFKSLMDLNIQAVRGLRLIHAFAIMQAIPSLTMLATLMLLTFLYRHPYSPIYAQFASFAVAAIAGVWIVNRSFKKRMLFDDAIQPTTLREIFSISMPMLMTASMQYFIAETGIVMLAMFRSEREVGYYSIAVKLATLTSFVLYAINSMAAPKFSELYHTGRIDELFHVARMSTKLIFWTTAPILLILVVLGRPGLALMFGKEFINAYPAMVFLVIGQFVNAISGSTGYFMNMTGHQHVLRNIVFIASIISVALGITLIPHYGINGAAFAGMISLCFWNVCTLVYIKIKFGATIGYVPMLKS